MKKINTAPLSGMQELLPKDQLLFESLKQQIETIYAESGFWKIESPVINRTEVLLAKAGGETEKQIYRVLKTDEKGESHEALRFDHTVPLARYVVEHENSLTFPFRVTQVGRNFRGERAQKGRFREFYQCDVDIIGRNNLPIAYDAEAIATIARALAIFHIPNLVVRISNRKIVKGLIEELGLANQTADISAIIDKAEKVTPEVTRNALEELGMVKDAVEKILKFIQIKGDQKQTKTQLQALEVQNETFKEGVEEIDLVLAILEAQNLPVKFRGDMMIVRGLDYYTGTVFETFVDDRRELGSLGGGGRYENLASNFSEQSFPGVGGSIGLSRVFAVLSNNNLLPERTKRKLVVIIPVSAEEFLPAARLAEKMRAENWDTDINFSEKKLGDKMNYANKIASHVIVLGAEEIEKQICTIKNLETGENEEYKI